MYKEDGIWDEDFPQINAPQNQEMNLDTIKDKAILLVTTIN